MLIKPCVAGIGIEITIVVTHVNAANIPIREIVNGFEGKKYPLKVFSRELYSFSMVLLSSFIFSTS
jgi:hypothetical protein